MAYFSPKKIINRKVVTKSVSGNQVYDIINQTTDHYREYHATEPAIVTEVFMGENELPNKETTDADNENVPNWRYAGSINAKFVMGTENLPKNIRPASHHMVTYPVPGEIVRITKIGGEYYYWPLPLNLHDTINLNKVRGKAGLFLNNLVSPQRTKFNRRIKPEQGDTLIQGRFGNSIKLGSDSVYENPNIRLVCGQAQFAENVFMKQTDQDLIHQEDINNDGNSIYMASGGENTKSMILPAFDSHHLPNKLYGNQIIVNSDRLIFNAKGDPGINTGSIHMFAIDQINLSSNGGLYVETGKNGIIALGTNAEVNKNPVVKGKELQSLLVEILKAVKEFSHKLGHAAGAVEPETSAVTLDAINEAGHECTNAMIKIEKIIPKIFSKTTFTI
tara:strand:+ start:169 stop:1338 length:1170 start_codon:yes stop_codon:yes gene_type:complete